tara:strand:- start:329 stop:673 length:345 start_codon:yes stop_codon:yes gene_type:complete
MRFPLLSSILEEINGNSAIFCIFCTNCKPAAKSFDPGENAWHPIPLKPDTMISAVFFALSVGVPGSSLSLLKNRLPASNMTTSNPSERRLSTIVAFRARPPRGFFFQPQGSVSP